MSSKGRVNGLITKQKWWTRRTNVFDMSSKGRVVDSLKNVFQMNSKGRVNRNGGLAEKCVSNELKT